MEGEEAQQDRSKAFGSYEPPREHEKDYGNEWTRRERFESVHYQVITTRTSNTITLPPGQGSCVQLSCLGSDREHILTRPNATGNSPARVKSRSVAGPRHPISTINVYVYYLTSSRVSSCAFSSSATCLTECLPSVSRLCYYY